MRQHELYEQLFSPANGQDQAVYLQQVIADAPYFGAAHFFLLKQTASSNAEWPELAAKTALHFNNPFLLNRRLKPPAVKKPAEEMLFEPLHATDYFASQGIKLSEEILQNDQLGKQMKSFTEWLKTIKKTNGYKLNTNAPIDKKVEEMAEKSNQESDTVTEAMAEVYLSQGKTEKANEIYKKLSLQNPSKSSYFAEKIK